MITVTVNGRPREFESELPLPELIRRLEITHPRIAIAHNGDVLRQEEHTAVTVRDGDTLEIVRMVGGGASGEQRVASNE
jgi:sulfur carrier protein